ncbi:PIN domain-containing protein [Microbacterium sp. P26]|uniref:PIN domain-containing protein n=1 Tax=Microbacterium TaxID=33882 RepID=UPI0020405E2C|nr:PIN domain-containing protein [Microbacterium sp. P26]MCM3502765.1 PIN domain-containing protein [Microbacterium sp. P26]
MTDYLVDNSVWARLASGDPAIRDRLERIARSPSDLFVTCPPQVVEFCHSARSPEEHAHYLEQISRGFPLERAPDETLAVGIPSALWNAGPVRATGTVDILIAAYAIANDATVLSADRDFEHIAAVSDLAYEYVAPTN